MTSFRIDGALFPTVDRKAIERVRTQIEVFLVGFFNCSAITAKDIHLQPFRNKETLIGINVAVTVGGTDLTSGFAGTVTLSQPILLIGLEEKVLVQFVRDVILAASNAAFSAEKLPANVRSVLASRYLHAVANESAPEEAVEG